MQSEAILRSFLWRLKITVKCKTRCWCVCSSPPHKPSLPAQLMSLMCTPSWITVSSDRCFFLLEDWRPPPNPVPPPNSPTTDIWRPTSSILCSSSHNERQTDQGQAPAARVEGVRVWPGLLLPIGAVAGVAVVVPVASGLPLPAWCLLCCKHPTFCSNGKVEHFEKTTTTKTKRKHWLYKRVHQDKGPCLGPWWKALEVSNWILMSCQPHRDTSGH